MRRPCTRLTPPGGGPRARARSRRRGAVPQANELSAPVEIAVIARAEPASRRCLLLAEVVQPRPGCSVLLRRSMQHPSTKWEAVDPGTWSPLPYYTGTPLWYRNSRSPPTGVVAPQSQPNHTYLFSTLGGPPPPVPTDLSQPHFLGQLRALKTERDILERQLEEARIARVEGHMWNAPPQWAGLRPGGSASRGWHSELPHTTMGSPQDMGTALWQQQREIEQLQLELGTLRHSLAQRRTQQGVITAASHRNTRKVVADIYKRYNPAKLPNVEQLAKDWRGKEDLLVRLLQRKYGA